MWFHSCTFSHLPHRKEVIRQKLKNGERCVVTPTIVQLLPFDSQRRFYAVINGIKCLKSFKEIQTGDYYY